MTFTRNDFSAMSDEAAISAASGYADGKILRVVTGAQYQDYEVSSVDSGDSVTMGDGKFANRVSGGGSGGAASWGSITGTLSNQTDLQQALDNKADATSLESLKTKTTKTTDASGVLPNWAAWIADSSSAALTRQAPATPEDGEEVTVFDSSGNAETNNIELVANTGQTVISGVLDKNGQSKKFRYDAGSSTWDLVFSDAPTSGGGITYEVQEKVLYISNGLVSETDTGAKLFQNRREVIDLSLHLDPEWIGEELWIKTEAYNDSASGEQGWGETNFVYITGGRGVNASEYGSEIIVQSGSSQIATTSSNQGNPYGGSVSLTSAKVKLTIIRLTYNNTQGLGNLVDVATIPQFQASSNTRYTFDITSELGADWVGKDIISKSIVDVSGNEGTPMWAYDTSSKGVRSDQLDSDTIVAQTGSGGVIEGNSSHSGSPFGSTSEVSSIPLKIKCYKLNDDAVAAGVVESTTLSIGTLSNNSRVITPISSLGSEFVGKTLITINEIQYQTNWSNPEFVYTSASTGARSYTLGSNVITQSGTGGILGSSNITGSAFGFSGTFSSAPSRIKAWRLG